MNSPAGSGSTTRSDTETVCLDLPTEVTCSGDGGFGRDENVPSNDGSKNRQSMRESSSLNGLSGGIECFRDSYVDNCLRESTRLAPSVSNGVRSVSPRKSGGKKLFLSSACPLRRSPRLGLCSAPEELSESTKKRGEFARNGSGKAISAPTKIQGMDGQKSTLKDEGLIHHEENSFEEFDTEPLQPTRNDDDDGNAPSAMNLSGDKQLRRSPRFNSVVENGYREDLLEGCNKRRKNNNGTLPSRRSLGFSAATENGHSGELMKDIGNGDIATADVKQVRRQANGDNSSNKVMKKSENDGPGFLEEKPLILLDESDLIGNESLASPSISEATETVCRDEYTRNFDDNKLILSGGEQQNRAASLNNIQKDDANNFSSKQFNSNVVQEMITSSNFVELPDSSTEQSNEMIENSINKLEANISKENISDQASEPCTDQRGPRDEDMTSSAMVPSKSVDESTWVVSSKLAENKSKTKTQRGVREKGEQEIEQKTCFFLGDPIPQEEAQERWRWRYELKNRRSKSRTHELDDDEDKIVFNVECHYSQAKINGRIFELGDCAHIEGEEVHPHVGKIIEFFKSTDGDSYFRVQWFYRAEDTVMKQQANFHDRRRLFLSSVMNDNPIDCIISKVTISQVSPRAGPRPNSKQTDYYFDMEYSVEYTTFRNLKNYNSSKNHSLSLSDGYETTPSTFSEGCLDDKRNHESQTRELALLDLYSGCGGMSTGLCLGAKISGVDLVAKWAVDMDMSACESLKLNHPQTHVRNDAADYFLKLLKEWEKLCKRYVFNDEQSTDQSKSTAAEEATSEISSSSEDDSESEEFEVEKVVDVCYGDPSDTGKHGLKYKVRWKGYSASEDTWEPAEGLSHCEDCIRNFVRDGFKSKILPLPGDCDVICGGPPCQGISGYNRFRHVDSPLTDERNRQIIVYMDIVNFLRPKFVLMENVVDLVRFDKGSLGRYALSRLVHMKYQARLGIMAAGCYGLAQFRLRVFLWGAHANERLPSFPLPTHDCIIKYGAPVEFERNIVAYDKGQPRKLAKALVLQDSISDLPSVTNEETREKISYENPPASDFERYIRSTKHEMTGSGLSSAENNNLLYDHRPLKLFEADYVRVCLIPKKKGGCFRDLPGVIVGDDGIVRRDPTMEQLMMPSGRPLLPDYVFTFKQGKSRRPFARLWWDEIVSTVITTPSCHSQAVLHPEQDRMLTIREYARFQGFPDYYRFCGTIKERYCQVGNAVAVSVSRALGYALGMAFRKLTPEDQPLVKLPPNFSVSNHLQLREIIPE